MKGISTEMIILILAVIIGIALLYYAWVSGFLKFGAGVSESDCYLELNNICSSAKTTGEFTRILGTYKFKCGGYITDNLQNCKNCMDNGDKESCRDCCTEDIYKWTPRQRG